MQRIFKVRKGTRNVSNKDVQVYGEELYNLGESSEGKLTPQYVVSKAKNKKSILHNYFVWDDTEAAHQYRVYQARKLINSIEIVYETDKGKLNQFKAFHNVKEVIDCEELDCIDAVTQSYVTVETVKENEFYLNQLIEKAHQEMAAWGRRYRQYKDLKGFKKFKTIFKELEKIV